MPCPRRQQDSPVLQKIPPSRISRAPRRRGDRRADPRSRCERPVARIDSAAPQAIEGTVLDVVEELVGEAAADRSAPHRHARRVDRPRPRPGQLERVGPGTFARSVRSPDLIPAAS